MQSETALTKSALNKSSPWLLFQVGNIGCAVSITDVQIVISEPKLTQLPACNAEYPGVFNHAGETFQVVDLHYKFMSKPCKQAKLILSQEADGRYAYRVSSVAAVMSIAETSWLYQKQLPGKVFNGVFAHEKHMVLCAEIAKLRKMSAQNIEAFIKSNSAKFGIAAGPETQAKNSQPDSGLDFGAKSKSLISAKESQITGAKQLIEKNATAPKSAAETSNASLNTEHTLVKQNNASAKLKTSEGNIFPDKTAFVGNQKSDTAEIQAKNNSEQKNDVLKSITVSPSPIAAKYTLSMNKGGGLENKKESISAATVASNISMPKPVINKPENPSLETNKSASQNAIVATRNEGNNKQPSKQSSQPVSHMTTPQRSVVGKEVDRETTGKSVAKSREFDQVDTAQKQTSIASNASGAVNNEPAQNGISTIISFSVLGLLLLAGLFWLIPWLVSELISKPARPEPYVSQVIEKKPTRNEELTPPLVSEPTQVASPTYDVITTTPEKQELVSIPSAVMNDANSLDSQSEINTKEPAQGLPDVEESKTETQMVFEPVEAMPVETMPIETVIDKRPSKAPVSSTSKTEKISALVTDQEAELQESKTETEVQSPVTGLAQTETITPVIEMDTAVTESGSKSIVINIIDVRAKFKSSTDQGVSNQLSVSTSQQRVHTVVRGDTLWHIAKHYLANPYRYPELARLSDIENPDLIYPGDKVIIKISAE